MKVLIGTKNPGKIKGATEALKNYLMNWYMIWVNVKNVYPCILKVILIVH